MSKITLLVLGTFLIVSCGGSGGGGGTGATTTPGNESSTVTGVNLSGTYSLLGIECYSDTTLGTLVSQATTNPSPTYGVVISGNNTATTWNDGVCRTNISNTYVFTQAGTLSGGAYGTYNSSAGSISIPTGQGSCTYTLSWTLASGSATISPASLTDTAVNGGSTSAQSGVYINLNSGYLVTEASGLSAQGYPSSICFWIYDKQ